MTATVRTVADLMTSPAVTAGPAETLEVAARRMAEAGVGSVVVAEANRPVGILTERDLMGVAQLRPVEGAFTDVPRGLKGVIVAETEIGEVRGLEGFYHYRQYSAVDVCTHYGFEDAWALLVDGHLPDADEAATFRAELAPLRRLPEPVAEVLPAIARAGLAAPGGAGSLDALRTAVSLLALAEGFRPSLDVSPERLRADGLRLGAAVPTLVAALHRLAHGMAPLEPREDLGHVANYLYMLHGAEPEPMALRAVEAYMTSTIEHGFNASTFTARVVTSTGADLGSAVVAALGSLSGPLHGGAPSRALDTLDAIGTPERTEAWVRDAIARGERIMGFGHPVYKTYDPRSAMLRDIAREMGGPLVDFAQQVEATILSTLAELKPDQELHTNVEYYAGVVMELAGLDRTLFTPTFAAARVVGWSAHILEQARDNRIIRPSARYVGPPPPQPLPR